MTSTNDGKDVKSNQTSSQKSKTYFIELYKSLEGRLSGECSGEERTRLVCEAWRCVHCLCLHSAPSTHLHLLSWLQRHTSHTILQTEWQSPKSKEQHSWLEEAINTAISECQEAAFNRNGVSLPWETQLRHRARWFLTVLPNPWGHHVLKALLDSKGPQPTDKEVLEWLKEERGVMFVARLRQLAASKCDDLALLLATAVMDRVRNTARIVADVDQAEEPKDKLEVLGNEPTFHNILCTEAGFSQEVWDILTDIEFVLLYKGQSRARCIELAKLTPLRNGYQLVGRLQNRLENSPQDKKLWKNAKDVATLIAQVVIARCMVIPKCTGVAREALYGCVYSLVQLLPPERLPSAAAALAAPAATSRHLHTLAAAVHAQCKNERKPFVCSLYVRAITAGMNELEKLKLNNEKESEARGIEQILASWFVQIGTLLSASIRLSYECVLTAFSVHPSPTMFEMVRRAPIMAPLITPDIQEKDPETNSEYGSWANDSRTQTNLVKTSETLKLKHTQKQGNVLSTTIFAEGEGLGLEADLCQDLAVLLSGPRLKTLYWDLDRDLLLENCRTYMERTHCGTRALTTELKYLHLDPNTFKHLPEEEDEDENNIYYGIEKGYEHLVEFEEPEPENILYNEFLIDTESTESASSTDIPLIIPKRKEKKSKRLLSSGEEVDPLSLPSDTLSQRNDRPHSKERSKHKKDKSKKVDSIKIFDENTKSGDNNKGIQKDKKKEKKERKKKDKISLADVKIKEKKSSSNLSRLVSMKIARPNSDHQRRNTSTNVNNACITDSDYDSQGKSSINSECNENVLIDGLYLIDDIKPPEKTDNTLTDFGQRTSFPLFSYVPETVSTVQEDVKKGIQKLMEYRRHKVFNENSISRDSPENQSPNCSYNQASPSNIHSPVISSKDVNVLDPAYINIGSKIKTNFTDEKESLNVCHRKVKDRKSPSLCRVKKSNSNILSSKNTSPVLKQNVNKFAETPNQKQYQEFLLQRKWNPIQDQINSAERIGESVGQMQFQEFLKKQYLRESEANVQSSYPQESELLVQPSPNTHQAQDNLKLQTDKITKDVSPSQKQFHTFLKELQMSINAGATYDMHDSKSSLTNEKPAIKKIIQQKKVDNAANTYSRLSYMHKNKQCDSKIKTASNQVTLNKPLVNVTPEQIQHLKDIDIKKVSHLQSTGQIIISKVDKSKNKCTNENAKVLVQTIENMSGLNSTSNNPVLSNMLLPNRGINTKNYKEPQKNECNVIKQSNKQNISSVSSNSSLNIPVLSNSVPSDKLQNTKNYLESVTNETKVTKQCNKPTTNLSEKDQLDLLLLLRQQSNMKPPTKQGNRDFPTNNPNILNRTTVSVVNTDNQCLSSRKINVPFHNSSGASSKSSPTSVIKVTNNKTLSSGLSEPKQNRKGSKQKANTESDWKSVMDDLLARKTPSSHVGPNALDIVLKKDSFEKRSSENFSKLNNGPVIASCTNVNNSANNDNIVKQPTQKIDTNVSISNESVYNLKPAILLADMKQKEFTIIQSTNKFPSSSFETKKGPVHDNVKYLPCTIRDSNDPFISGIPNSDYDLLEELMDDDLRQEIGELSSDDETYRSPNLCTAKKNLLTKESHPPIDKASVININSAGNTINYKLISDSTSVKKTSNTKNSEFKKGFLAKNDSLPKSVVNKNPGSAKNASLKPRILSNELILNSTPLKKTLHSGECHNVSSTSLDAPGKSTSQLKKNPVITTRKTKIQKSNKISANVCNNSNLDIIKVHKSNIAKASQIVLDPAQVVLTVPQRNTAQNVMLIGTDFIYDPFSTVHVNQSANSSNFSESNGNTYVAVNQMPMNVALLHTTPSVAPVLSPVIIERPVPSSVIQNVALKNSMNITLPNSGLRQKSPVCKEKHLSPICKDNQHINKVIIEPKPIKDENIHTNKEKLGASRLKAADNELRELYVTKPKHIIKNEMKTECIQPKNLGHSNCSTIKEYMEQSTLKATVVLPGNGSTAPDLDNSNQPKIYGQENCSASKDYIEASTLKTTVALPESGSATPDLDNLNRPKILEHVNSSVNKAYIESSILKATVALPGIGTAAPDLDNSMQSNILEHTNCSANMEHMEASNLKDTLVLRESGSAAPKLSNSKKPIILGHTNCSANKEYMEASTQKANVVLPGTGSTAPDLDNSIRPNISGYTNCSANKEYMEASTLKATVVLPETGSTAPDLDNSIRPKISGFTSCSANKEYMEASTLEATVVLPESKSAAPKLNNSSQPKILGHTNCSASKDSIEAFTLKATVVLPENGSAAPDLDNSIQPKLLGHTNCSVNKENMEASTIKATVLLPGTGSAVPDLNNLIPPRILGHTNCTENNEYIEASTLKATMVLPESGPAAPDLNNSIQSRILGTTNFSANKEYMTASTIKATVILPGSESAAPDLDNSTRIPLSSRDESESVQIKLLKSDKRDITVEVPKLYNLESNIALSNKLTVKDSTSNEESVTKFIGGSVNERNTSHTLLDEKQDTDFKLNDIQTDVSNDQDRIKKKHVSVVLKKENVINLCNKNPIVLPYPSIKSSKDDNEKQRSEFRSNNMNLKKVKRISKKQRSFLGKKELVQRQSVRIAKINRFNRYFKKPTGFTVTVQECINLNDDSAEKIKNRKEKELSSNIKNLPDMINSTVVIKGENKQNIDFSKINPSLNHGSKEVQVRKDKNGETILSSKLIKEKSINDNGSLLITDKTDINEISCQTKDEKTASNKNIGKSSGPSNKNMSYEYSKEIPISKESKSTSQKLPDHHNISYPLLKESNANGEGPEKISKCAKCPSINDNSVDMKLVDLEKEITLAVINTQTEMSENLCKDNFNLVSKNMTHTKSSDNVTLEKGKDNFTLGDKNITPQEHKCLSASENLKNTFSKSDETGQGEIPLVVKNVTSHKQKLTDLPMIDKKLVSQEQQSLLPSSDIKSTSINKSDKVCNEKISFVGQSIKLQKQNTRYEIKKPHKIDDRLCKNNISLTDVTSQQEQRVSRPISQTIGVEKCDKKLPVQQIPTVEKPEITQGRDINRSAIKRVVNTQPVTLENEKVSKDMTCSDKDALDTESDLLMKDLSNAKISIEDIPNAGNGPSKRCLRIKLPNGNTFKATISGKLNANIDSIFEDPVVKSILWKNINNNSKCTLNIKQVTVQNQNKEILKTEVKNITYPKSKLTTTEEAETINLISDEEEDDNPKILKTEFGDFNIASLNPSLYEKHKKKLAQKSVVVLERCNVFENIAPIVKKDKASDKDINIVSRENLLSTSQEIITDCIEIDDSSNDSLSLISSVTNTNENETVISSEKVDKLKNLLLKDLGVLDTEEITPTESHNTKVNYENTEEVSNNNIIQTKKWNLSNSKINTIEQINNDMQKNGIVKDDHVETQVSSLFRHIIENNSKQFLLKIKKCDDLAEQLLSIQKNKCFVRLVRCDDTLQDGEKKIKLLTNNNVIDKSSDSVLHLEDESVINELTLKRSGSSSILNELQDTTLEEYFAPMSPSLIGNFEIPSDLIETYSDSSVFVGLSSKVCDADWFMTKWFLNKYDSINYCHPVILSAREIDEDSLTDCSDDLDVNFSTDKSYQVPSLLKLNIDFLANHSDIVDKLINRDLTSRSVINSSPLERKSSPSVEKLEKIEKFEDSFTNCRDDLDINCLMNKNYQVPSLVKLIVNFLANSSDVMDKFITRDITSRNVINSSLFKRKSVAFKESEKDEITLIECNGDLNARRRTTNKTYQVPSLIKLIVNFFVDSSDAMNKLLYKDLTSRSEFKSSPLKRKSPAMIEARRQNKISKIEKKVVGVSKTVSVIHHEEMDSTRSHIISCDKNYMRTDETAESIHTNLLSTKDVSENSIEYSKVHENTRRIENCPKIVALCTLVDDRVLQTNTVCVLNDSSGNIRQSSRKIEDNSPLKSEIELGIGLHRVGMADIDVMVVKKNKEHVSFTKKDIENHKNSYIGLKEIEDKITIQVLRKQETIAGEKKSICIDKDNSDQVTKLTQETSQHDYATLEGPDILDLHKINEEGILTSANKRNSEICISLNESVVTVNVIDNNDMALTISDTSNYTFQVNENKTHTTENDSKKTCKLSTHPNIQVTDNPGELTSDFKTLDELNLKKYEHNSQSRTGEKLDECDVKNISEISTYDRGSDIQEHKRNNTEGINPDIAIDSENYESSILDLNNKNTVKSLEREPESNPIVETVLPEVDLMTHEIEVSSTRNILSNKTNPSEDSDPSVEEQKLANSSKMKDVKSQENFCLETLNLPENNSIIDATRVYFTETSIQPINKFDTMNNKSTLNVPDYYQNDSEMKETNTKKIDIKDESISLYNADGNSNETVFKRNNLDNHTHALGTELIINARHVMRDHDSDVIIDSYDNRHLEKISFEVIIKSKKVCDDVVSDSLKEDIGSYDENHLDKISSKELSKFKEVDHNPFPDATVKEEIVSLPEKSYYQSVLCEPPLLQAGLLEEKADNIVKTEVKHSGEIKRISLGPKMNDIKEADKNEITTSSNLNLLTNVDITNSSTNQLYDQFDETKIVQSERSEKDHPCDAITWNLQRDAAFNDVQIKTKITNIHAKDDDDTGMSIKSYNNDIVNILNVNENTETPKELSHNDNLVAAIEKSIDYDHQDVNENSECFKKKWETSHSVNLTKESPSENQTPRPAVSNTLDNRKLKQNITLVYKGDSNVILKGSIYEDPVIGTCYVFPVKNKTLTPEMDSSNVCDDKRINFIETLKSKVLEDCSELNIQEDVQAIENFKVILPKFTYSRQRFKNNDVTNTGDKTNRKFLKRKLSVSCCENNHGIKRYRKGKNIDYPKLSVVTVLESGYSKEYKRLMDYCTSIKFSYSRPFHKEYIDVPNLLKCWPIEKKEVTLHDDTDYEHIIFSEDQFENQAPFDPLQQTLAEEISQCKEKPYISYNINETNFNMGFGEGSDRVKQISEDENNISKVSAATLSDVKQSQPFLTPEDHVDCNKNKILCMSHKHQIEILKRSISYIQLRDKVRSFFKKTTAELNYNWFIENLKSKYKNSCNNSVYLKSGFPYELINTEFIEPAPVEAIVQVVQVGQLPVSAAAQNPVTCDPRVTQVTDASPQCSIENSPHDDSQSPIKTEYTELTTADLSLPLVQEYDQQMESQESSKMPNSHHEDIPVETEITSIVKTEITVELSPMKEEPIDYNDSDDLQSLVNKHINNVDYSFDSNDNSILEPQSNTDLSYESLENFSPPQEKQQNGSTEKTDQIAHAMNAAGITTTSETMVNTKPHSAVNMLSQKNCQQVPAATTTSSANSYSKTPINAMTLQQALAQILPPPLNQTSVHENNQTTTNSTVTPQVLHIVQGKNTNSNQITLVDNTQNSVINNTNTPMLHIVQNKGVNANSTPNPNSGQHTNSYSGLSLVDAGIQQASNQLLHIVNTGNQKNNTTGQLLKRVNLLTNLANVQGSNEQKMVQFVCKSADGKPIHLNTSHQRSMVLRLQPIESPNVPPTPKTTDSQDNTTTSPSSNNNSVTLNKESTNGQHEIKSRSVYEENYAKFIQNSSNKTVEKSTSLPKFGQAFGKQVYQDGNKKSNDINANNSSNLSSINTNSVNTECQPNDNSVNLDQIGQINSPPLLLRKSPSQPAQTQPSQPNLVQQIKQTIAPMNIQTMHGGVIYTRQIPVNIGGGQTINLITVPSTELIDDQKQKVNQNEVESQIIKIVPQNQNTQNAEGPHDDANNHTGTSNENSQSAPTQHQPVLTQMRIKLPMLSKTPQMVSGARVVRPSFFQIQRNVIGGANQHVYQQLVLTAAPPLGQHTIRLPQAQANRPVTSTSTKTTTEGQSTSEHQMSSSTLEQLREFDMVLEQVKERSTVQPNSNPNNNFTKLLTPTTESSESTSVTSTVTESTQQVLYSIGSNQSLNVAYINRKTAATTPTTSTFVRSPDSTGVIDSPSSSHVQIPHTVTSESTVNEASAQPTQPKPAKVGSKSKSRPKSSSNPPSSLKINTLPPKPSTQKPLEDEQTTQRILYILAEYKEQVENSPDKDKPAPRRRSNPPTNPSGSSKRKKSSSGSRRPGARDMSPVHGEDTCRTMGSEDSSCGTSQGDCNESCLDSHSPQDSPRKVVRKLTFENETPPATQQPRPQPQRNVIVADGQTITVARGTAGKPATAVLMPANYILPVSMVKGGQQIAIVTNRGPKLLTVGGGEGGATNALLLQRLIGPAGLKPVLARPGVRHVRLPTAALHNLQAFNLTAATTVQPPDSTASPAPASAPPELIETRTNNSPWTDRENQDVKPERDSSPEGSEPWNLPSSADPQDYTYEETVRTDNMDRTVLEAMPDRYSPDMEAQRIFDKMFDVESKKSYIDSHDDSSRCAYDIDDDKVYHQVVHKKDGTSQRHHRLTHVSSAALRHKYAILEHELRLQKSLSEECEDLGVDSPSASELFPEAELLFAASPAHDAPQHPHTPQPTILNQSGIPQPDIDDQIATDELLQQEVTEEQQELDVTTLGLDEGIVTVSEDGMQATIALDQEEFARSHPNTTFHSSEPNDDGEVQPFTIAGLKGRHITSTIFHAGRAPATVLVTAPQTTVISQANPDHTLQNNVKYANMEQVINSSPATHGNLNMSSVLVKDDGLTKFDNILTDSRELHLSNTASAIVHSTGNATQVIRRVCYEDDKRDTRFLMDEPDALIAGDYGKIAEDSSRDATLESIAGDDDNSSPERHAELFWESNSASERSESRRPMDFSSDSEKCCKSPSYDETNSTDSSGVGTHMRLDSVIKEARGIERSGSADGSSADDTHPPLRTYPAKRMYHAVEGEMERSVSGKTRAGERSPDNLEVRRRASGRGVVKRGCHCCSGSPPRAKKPRQKKPTMDFNN